MKSHPSMQQYNYHVWANNLVFRHLKELPDSVDRQQIQSVFPSLYDCLTHIYRVDTTWLQAMAGVSYEDMYAKVAQVAEAVQGKTLAELETMYHELTEKFRDLFERQDLDEIRAYSHPQFGTLHAPYTEIIQHLVNHGTFHRGNISAMLRQLGHPGTPTDYILYLYEVNRQL